MRVGRRARFAGNEKIELARQMRRSPTDGEAAVWALVRNRGLLGLKFRRQAILRGYIVDFYCPALRLVLEVDGNVHDDPTKVVADRLRRDDLERVGLREIRINNEEVSRAKLIELIQPFAPVLPPLPEGRGGLGGEDPPLSGA